MKFSEHCLYIVIVTLNMLNKIHVRNAYTIAPSLVPQFLSTIIATNNTTAVCVVMNTTKTSIACKNKCYSFTHIKCRQAANIISYTHQ